MKTKFLLVLAFWSVLLSSCNEHSNEVINVPEVKTSIYGYVINIYKQGIPNAQITTSPGSSSVVTDQYGNYIINDPVEGSYKVYVHSDGYADDSVSIYVSKGKETEASFKLMDYKEAPLPAKPYLKTPLQASVVEGDNALLSWTQDDLSYLGIVYDVYFDTDPACKTLKFPNVGLKYLGVYGLQSGKDYYWKVVAKNSAGKTNDGGVWSFHVK